MKVSMSKIEQNPKEAATKRETVYLDNGDVLWNADPDCDHRLDPNCWSGIRCLKCSGWDCL